MDFTTCNAITADCGVDKIAIGQNCYKATIDTTTAPTAAPQPQDDPNIHFYSTYQYGQFTKTLKEPFQTGFLDCALQCVQTANCQAFSFQQPSSVPLDITTQGTCQLGAYWQPIPPDKQTFTLNPTTNCQVVYAKSNTAQLQLVYASGNQPATITWGRNVSCNCSASSQQWMTVYNTAEPQVLAGFTGTYGNIITSLWNVNKLAFNLNTLSADGYDLGSWDCHRDCSNCTCFNLGLASWGVSQLIVVLDPNCHLKGIQLLLTNIYDHRISRDISAGNLDGSGGSFVEYVTPAYHVGTFLTDTLWTFENHSGDGMHCVTNANFVQLGITGDASQLGLPLFAKYLTSCDTWSAVFNKGTPIVLKATATVLPANQTFPTDLQDAQKQTTIYTLTQTTTGDWGMIYINVSLDPSNYGLIVKWDSGPVEKGTIAFSDMAADGSVSTVDGLFILTPSSTCAAPPGPPKNVLISLHSTSGSSITIDPESTSIADQKPLIQSDHGGVTCRTNLANNTYDDSDPAAKTAMQLMQDWCSDPEHKSIETCVAFCQNAAYAPYCPWASTENRSLVIGLIAGWFVAVFVGILLYRNTWSTLNPMYRKIGLGLVLAAIVILPIITVPKLLRLLKGEYGGGGTTQPEFSPPATQEPASVQQLCEQSSCFMAQCKDFLAGTGPTACYCPNACTGNTQCPAGAPCVPVVRSDGKPATKDDFYCQCPVATMTWTGDCGTGSDAATYTDKLCTKMCLPAGTTLTVHENSYECDKYDDTTWNDICCSGKNAWNGSEYACL